MNHSFLTPAPNGKETRLGTFWLVFTFFFLPILLQTANFLLGDLLSAGMLNFVYYSLNFAGCLWIFRRFLKTAMTAALRRPFQVLWYAVLGYLGYQALTELATLVILFIEPDFFNVNDDNIHTMLSDDLIPLAIGTIFLVPLAEEMLYRGLIFRKLYDKKPMAGYLASMAVFAAIHVTGYIGIYPPLTLLLCFVQYLPAGYCLCWCYRQSGTIICPILMHAMVNATAIFYAVR